MKFTEKVKEFSRSRLSKLMTNIQSLTIDIIKLYMDLIDCTMGEGKEVETSIEVLTICAKKFM